MGVAVGSPGDIIVTGYLTIAIGALAVGVLQWLLLWWRFTRDGWWLVASIGAVAVVGVLVFGVGLLSADVGWVAGVSAFGTVVGVLQWWVLRRQFARAGWWILASTVAWIAGSLGVGFVSSLLDTPSGYGWAALGAVYGAITGSALMWLRRLPG